MAKSPQGNIHRIKLISLTGEPIRIADIQATINPHYATRLLFELCRNNYIVDWTALENLYSAKMLLGIVREVNRQFRHGKTAFRLIADGIQ